MHDLKSIRQDPDSFDLGLGRRGVVPASGRLLALDSERRQLQTRLQALQNERNGLSRDVGRLKAAGGEAAPLLERVAAIKGEIAALESDEQRIGGALDSALATLPNLPDPDVPDGLDEQANREIRRVGDIPDLPGAVPHYELGERLGLMDFATAAKLAGARFTVLRGPLARLERALGNLMLDIHTREFGYTEVAPPLLVNDQTVFGTGQLPKAADDMFRTTDGRWLIPTAEVSLTNLVADSIIEERDLPLRVTAFTPCFRSEAGAAGRDTRGMIRQHQFAKVELVSIARPEESDAEHERMTSAAEAILQRLGLPYRVMLLSAGDMGFTARKTYDLEVWLPGQGAYREISSCSNCGDFQARRMKARYRPGAGGKETRFVHTLNGSGLAVGRTLVAVMENYQQPGGSIRVPEALKPYFGGVEVIGP